MSEDVEYECDVCGQDFGEQREAEEHVIYNHDVVEDRINVTDPRNMHEPGGL